MNIWETHSLLSAMASLYGCSFYPTFMPPIESFVMLDILAKVFRKSIHWFVTWPALYLPGMVLVRLARGCRKQAYHAGATPEWHEVRLAGHIRMQVDRHTYMGGGIYWTGYHHLQEILYLNRRLRPGMIFVDVGANQGEFSLFAASKLSKGRVISFEPVSKLRQVLQENIQLNAFDQVDVYAFGLSDKNGTLPIFTSTETDIHFGRHEGLSTLYPSSSRNMLEETIELRVFDELFSFEEGQDIFLKIDVEGAEWYVLKGMRRFLEKNKPEILIEINEETFNHAGYTTHELVTYLQTFGYAPYQIKRGFIFPVAAGNLSAWGNYIFKAGA